MQDAFTANWARESPLSAENLVSLRGLNHRFLDLAAAAAGRWNAGGVGGVSAPLAERVGSLSALQREAAAGCPYALFDLRFQYEGYWRSRLQRGGDHWRVSDETYVDDAMTSFTRLALFYAWHVASSTGVAAQLLLGMHPGTAAAFRRITLNRLPALVVSETANLSPRWSECTVYWNALMGAASRTDPVALRKVQLYGLQLAAAVRLS